MGSMVVTCFLSFLVVGLYWAYPLWLCLLATGFFALIDSTLLGATLLKVHEGGWFPLLLGFFVFVVMATWRRGREILFERLRAASVALEPFLKSIFLAPPGRAPGTAVFPSPAPPAAPRPPPH